MKSQPYWWAHGHGYVAVCAVCLVEPVYATPRTDTSTLVACAGCVDAMRARRALEVKR